jgi:hypothetical protein
MHFVALVLILWNSVTISMSPKIAERHAIRHYEIPVLEGNHQIIIQHFVAVAIS